MATYKYQGSVEVLVIFLDVSHVIFCRLPLVHCIEVKPGIVVLDRLEEYPQSIVEARFTLWSAMQWIRLSDVPLRIYL